MLTLKEMLAYNRLDNPGKYDMQTVIVSKEVARTRKQAEKIADEYAKKAIYTSRETGSSYRFRMRPPEDFRKNTFRSRTVEPGVTLVFGQLKKGRKPISGKRRKNPIAADAVEEDSKQFKKHVALGDQIMLYDLLPDPQVCAWIGDTLEMAWFEPGKKPGEGNIVTWTPEEDERWMFMWCPPMRAVIAWRQPPAMEVLPDIKRTMGGALAYERFMAREPTRMLKTKMPAYNLRMAGKGVHIVYQSDKWNPGRDVDYIHDFEDGVYIYADNPDDPEILVAFGGKLTLTERGLIF